MRSDSWNCDHCHSHCQLAAPSHSFYPCLTFPCSCQTSSSPWSSPVEVPCHPFVRISPQTTSSLFSWEESRKSQCLCSEASQLSGPRSLLCPAALVTLLVSHWRHLLTPVGCGGPTLLLIPGGWCVTSGNPWIPGGYGEGHLKGRSGGQRNVHEDLLAIL